MAQTLATSTGLYLPVSVFLDIKERRRVLELASDDGTPIIESDAEDNAKILYAIRRAGGTLEAACIRGERYSIQDLKNSIKNIHSNGVTLVDPPEGFPTNSQAFVYGLVADLAFGFLAEKRQDLSHEEATAIGRAMALLDEIACGQKILAYAESADAGHMQATLKTPAEIATANGVVYQASRLYGKRSDRNN